MFSVRRSIRWVASVGSCLTVLAISTALTPHVAWASVHRSSDVSGIQTADQQSAVSAVIVGGVRDAAGQPLVGARVVASRGGRTIATAVSEAAGRYRLVVPAGTIRLSVVMIGSSPFPATVDAVGGATTTVDLEAGPTPLEGLIATAAGPGGGTTSLGEAPVGGGVVDAGTIRRRAPITPTDAIQDEMGVDLAPTGLQSSVVTFRGFNNIFSGLLSYLTDFRKASLPSLRANFTHFTPTTTWDIARMEYILGPSSALYGPNSAGGVLNAVTRSPLEPSETAVVLSGGEQSVRQGQLRTSHRLSDRLGFKISGQWFQGEEYAYLDPAEVSARAAVANNPDSVQASLEDLGLSADEALLRMDRMGVRDNDLDRRSVDVRADFAPSEGDTVIVQAGRTETDGVELTPLGAGRTDGWSNSYAQARLHSGRLFLQSYLNWTDAGESFLIRDGAPLADRSKLFVAQARHGFALGSGRAEITYGADYFRTTPDTEGTIHGQFEGDDEIEEYGGFGQVDLRLTDRLDLVGTLRYDESTVVDDGVLSPRVGVVFEPTDGQSFRVSWARGFSTPTPTNFFLDISGGTVGGDLGALGFRGRARGTGRDGITFNGADGTLVGMRSPFNPTAAGGPSELLPTSPDILWQYAVGLLRQQGAIDDGTAAFLVGLDASGLGINVLDPTTEQVRPLEPFSIQDVEALDENTTSTLEVGYQGTLGDAVVVRSALWRTVRENFTSPLTAVTPLLLLDGGSVAQLLVQNGMPAEQASALAEGIAPVPLAVASSPDIQGQGAEVVLSYRNFGRITYWGFDLGLQARLSRSLSISGAASVVSDDHFDVDGTILTLNAPAFRGSLSLLAERLPIPFVGEAVLRHQARFPVISGEFTGISCVDEDDAPVGDCVEDATLVDLSLAYTGLSDRGLTLRLNASNLFNSGYRPFLGVPTIERRVSAQVEYLIR